MLRILALELLFQSGVGFRPKRLKTPRYLHRAMARREDVERERVATESDFDVIRHTVEILDSCREKGIRRLGVSDLRPPTSGKLDALRGVLFDELLLLPSEE